jgi:exodeoxyribonuclease VIII
MMEQGIYLDLPSNDYHGDKTSFSRSSLLDFKKSPRKYWARHLNPERPPEEPKPSWILGTAFHTLILEPALFDKNYIVLPEKVLLREVGREAYDEYKKAEKEAKNSKGKILLSWADSERLRAMQKSLSENEKARQLIENAEYETSYFWQDEHSGLMVKSRPDIINGNLYIDLKTIEDANPGNYQREMGVYGYHIQAAMVQDGHYKLTGEKIAASINICVEKSYPYSIGIYIIDELAIEAGHCEYKQLLLDLKLALAHNEWADYPVQTIGLPRWAI